MDERNQKLIEAVIKKSERCCPGSLALIGVYGSAATGDTHEKSDLDLMLLINDDRGYQLAQAFILDDVDIGYDVYCTTWNMLESDAGCDHAHLSKLFDSKIVYVNDTAVLARLDGIKNKAIAVLSSDMRYKKAENAFRSAKERYAECFMTDSISDIRMSAAGLIHDLLNSVMLYHGIYFRKGTKRTFEEIGKCNLPFDMEELVMNVIRAESICSIQRSLKTLMLSVKEVLVFPCEREVPSSQNLSGTYEEIYSNWKNKMKEAADNEDLYSSFMNMVSFQFMLSEIEESVAISKLDVLGQFDSKDLYKNEKTFDDTLSLYLKEYEGVGLKPKRYNNVDEFLSAYLQ